MKNNVTSRRYNILADFSKVYDFLVETFSHETLNSCLIPQGFEYAHHLLWFDYIPSHRMGIWEDNGVIVGLCAYEIVLRGAHLHIQKGYEFLFPDLLDWAEKEITVADNGKKILKVWITDTESYKRDLLTERGYELDWKQAVSIFDYEKPFLERSLPEGFRLIDGNDVDFEKLGKCFWYGFNNEEEPAENIGDANQKTALAPHADLSLLTVVVAPNGEYASALGMWYDDVNKYAYLEPMATVPKYRRMGLGTIALMTAMQKTKDLGATYCFGGPVMEYYPQIGFEVICHREVWKKTF